jgi:thioredoxin reductase
MMMKTLVILLVSILSFSIANANDTDRLTIAPNVKAATIELRVTKVKATDATITITNEAGVVISTKKVTLLTGANAIELINVKDLAEGTFTVTVTTTTGTSQTQFVNWSL